MIELDIIKTREAVDEIMDMLSDLEKKKRQKRPWNMPKAI